MSDPSDAPETRPKTVGTDDGAAVDALASRFFAAIERGDLDAIEAIYSPDVAVWVNVTRQTSGLAANLRLLRSFTARVRDLHYEVEERSLIPGGFVQRHTITGRLASGETISVPVALIVRVADGRITRIDEYLDSAAIAPVFA